MIPGRSIGVFFPFPYMYKTCLHQGMAMVMETTALGEKKNPILDLNLSLDVVLGLHSISGG